MTIKIENIKIENFKAINKINLSLGSGLTVLVGQNSSGKSSVLQSIHWACRCVANPRIQRNQTRSISVHEFDFYPTTQIRSVGHNKELRQGRGDTKEVSVKVTFGHYKEGDDHSKFSSIKISQGNNEAVKVDLKDDAIDSDFYNLLSSRNEPFSSYIPGLAGVPLSEEKRSKLPIIRQAASGDANTVLRNILLQISESGNPKVSLRKLSQLCSSVLGEIEISVEFNEATDTYINAKFRTNHMPDGFWSPIEMAGTGVLQCIQIFSYIVLYNPHLLLIDEPDAHLHPDRQEKLVTALSQAAEEYKMRVIMTTHSPNVIRALPKHANIVWMKEGAVNAEDTELVRKKMGWGILDKNIILITEDQDTSLIKALISQWPDLERQISIWPVSGYRSLPSKIACESLLDITGVDRIVLHRDGDFLTPEERQTLQEKYNNNKIRLWITDDSDIESYFMCPKRIAKMANKTEIEILDIYTQIIDENKIILEDKFSSKRAENSENRQLYERRDLAPQVATARSKINNTIFKFGCIHGKVFSKKLKQKLPQINIFDINQDDCALAQSLREAIIK
ncbi:ATP-dependent nuclease [Aeromonas allosaccharophila]|uniref:ATP-dependent nuclease n=1 Tax=Aeromonas allosaccharophila TaxID=656 RepID=UPI002ADF32FE|nr:AAA family ATPase [Aeromonas allosaccharophila]